jgi:ankyrin repeat protein
MAHYRFCSAVLLACLVVLPVQAATKKINVNTLLIKRQYGAAIRQLEAAANKGDARAQFKLGSMYRVGLGVPNDSNRATLWLKKSAARGNRAAAAVLKRMAVTVPATAKKSNATPPQTNLTEPSMTMTWLPPRQPEQESWLALAAARNLPKVVTTLNEVGQEYFAVRRDRALLAGTTAGSGEVVTALLEAGANPNTRDQRARTPLLIATSTRNEKLLHQLLKAAPDLSTVDATGTSALGYAAVNCDAQIFKTLVNQGAKDSDSTKPALIRVFKSCDNAAEFLATIRGNLVGAVDGDGRSIVWYAAGLENSAIFSTALAAGGDITVADKQGYTPLHVAALTGRLEIIKLILALGGSADVQSRDGATPLMLAASAGRSDSVSLLVEQTSDIDVKDSAGDTALLRAVRGGQHDSIKILLQKGANRRARSISGETPEKLAQRTNTAISELFAVP